jgi:hypothetical protein
MKQLLMMFVLILFVGAPVVLAGDNDPNGPTECKVLAGDEGDGGTDGPAE